MLKLNKHAAYVYLRKVATEHISQDIVKCNILKLCTFSTIMWSHFTSPEPVSRDNANILEATHTTPDPHSNSWLGLQNVKIFLQRQVLARDYPRVAAVQVPGPDGARQGQPGGLAPLLRHSRPAPGRVLRQ